jgi:hypothetical protein
MGEEVLGAAAKVEVSQGEHYHREEVPQRRFPEVSTPACPTNPLKRIPQCPQVGEEVLGVAAKVEVSKESTTIVGDGRSEEAVKARVRQIRNLIAETEQEYEKEKLNERVARLSGGVAIIQVGIGAATGVARFMAS